MSKPGIQPAEPGSGSMGRVGRISPQCIGALALVACLIHPAWAVPAQSDTADAHAQAPEDTTTAPANRVIPVPIIYYTPETGTAFGAAIGYLFRPRGARSEDRPSTVGVQAIYTTMNQIIAGIGGEMYLGGDRYLLSGGLGYSRFPTMFWGVGNDTPDSAEEDYTPLTFDVMVGLRKQVATGWWAGGGAQFAYREFSETEAGGLLDTGAVPGAQDGPVVSVGLSIARDTRHNIIYPTSGANHQLGVVLASDVFGSDYDYSTLSLDLRQYFSLFPSQVLALRGLGIVSVGTLPFDRMPALGGESLLRGYFAGRYRDRDLLAFQAEYRARIWWRFGAVAFVGAGQVSHGVSGFALDEFWGAYGWGIRFLLLRDEGLNLRADFGFGENSSGFYLGVGEAF